MNVYLETYGCQMNLYDSELIQSILIEGGYTLTPSTDDADVVLMNTCAIRENAHRKIYGRLDILRPLKKQREQERRPFVVGVLGCMAQNLKEELLAHPVANLVVGPDNYRALPDLISNIAQTSAPEISAFLSEYETYSDIAPTRKEGVNAWLAIMRGCDNFCSFCVVPYTRGRERSRSVESILQEVRHLVEMGYPQVTLLGQNVNSYRHEGAVFADLISDVAQVNGLKRVRFTSPHPKDFPEAVLRVIAKNQNICKHIHLPLQSGSDRILSLMNRTYTAHEYLNVVEMIHSILPTATITTDIIVGFPTETEDDFQETVRLMNRVGFNNAYIFKYSERKGTTAARDYPDDIPEITKTDRIVRLNAQQHEIAFLKHQSCIGQTVQVLIEGDADKGLDHLTGIAPQMGKTEGNLTVVFPKTGFQPGEFVSIGITETTAGTLYGKATDSRRPASVNGSPLVWSEVGRPSNIKTL